MNAGVGNVRFSGRSNKENNRQSAVSMKSNLPFLAMHRRVSPIDSTSTRGPIIPKHLAFEFSYFRKEEEVFVA